MNTQEIPKNNQTATDKIPVKKLLENLRRKVSNFAVIDKQGQLIGEVRDLMLDANRQLNLVVSKLTRHTEPRQNVDNREFILLLSKLIQKIDVATKSVFINIDKSLIQYMPEYSNSQAAANSGSQTQEVNIYDGNSNLESENSEEISESEMIQLLGERLVVNLNKRKIGDIIVRKEIETRMVQVPVRREKLIIEQINPEHKQLAEIDLGQEEIASATLNEPEIPEAEIGVFEGGLSVSGEFNSPKIASLLLNAIALEKNHGCQKVRVSILVEDEASQKKYQEWFNRTSKS